MTHLCLAFDVGGSSSKMIYQLPESDRPQYLLMPPEVEPIELARFQEYRERSGWLGNPVPERDAWLECDNQQVVVVGAMAAKFDPKDRLSELKYENALYKVLAGIGAICQKHSLPKNKKLKVNLALLLPWTEYTDRLKFEQKLAKMLESYKFRGQQFKVELSKFVCRPEGFGLAVAQIANKGMDWLQQKRIAVLMLGHRNTTALIFEGGELKFGDSPLLGFKIMLERVCQLKSGLEREKLAAALFAAKASQEARNQIYRGNWTYYPDWEDLDEIQALATARDPKLKQLEIQEIARSIKKANHEYWRSLNQWLDKVLPSRLDEVIISGGAAHFLEPDLEERFNCSPRTEYSTGKVVNEYKPRDRTRPFTPLIWGHALGLAIGDGKKEIKEILRLHSQEARETALACRLVDVYGLFAYLSAKNEREAVA